MPKPLPPLTESIATFWVKTNHRTGEIYLKSNRLGEARDHRLFLKQNPIDPSEFILFVSEIPAEEPARPSAKKRRRY